MSLINIIDVAYQAGSKKLFNGLSFSIEHGDRIGLVGHNGCGKSSLLSLLLSEHEPDDGLVQRQRGLRVGRVEQFLPQHLERSTARDALLEALPSDEQQTRAYEVEALLESLGFKTRQQNTVMGELSGGQKNLVLFARALILEPELLLLDEPGNHMDVSAMAILKSYLSGSDVPAFLMISHDRDLLDSVTQRTLWIRDERAYSFHLPYSDARLALQAQDDAAAKKREAEEKEIDKLKVSAKRLATWGKVYDNEDLSRKAKSMERRIEKLEDQKTFVSLGSGLSLRVDAELLKTKQIFTFDHQSVVTPDGRTLFNAEDLTFRPGDRIALLGVNGSGKSTCIRTLLSHFGLGTGEQTTTRFNPNVRIGYFDQELDQFDESCGVFDWVRNHSNAKDDEIKQTLIQWGFAYKDHGRNVEKLSGGERARLLLLTFQLDQPNFLIMDEPTNHIDLQGKEALEADLTQTGLSLLFTSHDRQFIEKVANRFWWIHNGELQEVHDVESFYSSLSNTMSTGNDAPKFSAQGKSVPEDIHDVSEEAILERIVELETLIAEDQARKPKFQKPKLQASWQAELEQRLAQLN